MNRSGWVVMLALIVVVIPRPADADAPGPTDYQSEVTGVEPPSDRFAMDIIGGDSFVRLVVDGGSTVEVVGYEGEPYLRFGPDGVVEVNRTAPSTYTSEDRFGVVEIPATAFIGALPKWEVVATDGVYAWHDHRAHWMNPQSPPGAQPGDQILEGVIPLVVDGSEVDVTVISTWEQPASRAPLIVGGVAGLGAVALAWKRSELAMLSTGVVAAGLGSVAFFSVPFETAPSWLLWVLPVTSLVILAAGRGRLLASSVQLLVGAVLIGWVGFRRDWLTAAILPTVVPTAVDQALTTLVAVSAAGLVVRALQHAVRPESP